MSREKPEFRPETFAARGDGAVTQVAGAVMPPLHVSTTYARTPSYEQVDGRGYSRDDNPTYEPVEALIARLEGGAEARLFASGMAAIAAIFQALAPGDHVVVSQEQYFGTPKWLRYWAEPWGLEVSFVDTGDMAAIAAALRPGRTRLVYVESPANPTWRLTDLAAAAEVSRSAGALLVVDNTVATPVLTRPIEWGADLVVHSATKFLNGHSDVVAGVTVAAGPSDLWQRICALRHMAGPVLGPFEAWLLQRGLRTLFVRVERASASALAIAERLRGHPAIERVMYPGLPDFPGHDIAARQMRGGFGGMMSIAVRGGAAEALDLASRVRVFIRATSLGGVESLIEHRFTIEGADTMAPPNLLRLSIGLEAAEDLIEDLLQALPRS